MVQESNFENETLSNEDKERCELWRFYEKAIEGRNFLYKHYIQYMNLYAIFTGALFVAFYTLLDKPGYNRYSLLVALLGLMTSFLWLCSVKGYYAWIISWLNVVRFYEDLLNRNHNVRDACFVYALYGGTDDGSCLLTKPSHYSTQKLTMLFVEFVILGWFVSILLMIGKVCPITSNLLDKYACLFVVILVLILLMVVVCICFTDKLKDDVSYHYKLVPLDDSGDEKVKARFSVKPPEKW